MKISTLTPGQTVLAGYIRGERRFFGEAVFLGATWGRPEALSRYQASGETVSQMKEAAGYRNLKALEAALDQEGCRAYAVFKDPEGGYTWAAYLWEGSWRVGSSGDRLRVLAAD
jgi:hypothetical protein